MYHIPLGYDDFVFGLIDHKLGHLTEVDPSVGRLVEIPLDELEAAAAAAK